jgi:hypothetical protein
MEFQFNGAMEQKGRPMILTIEGLSQAALIDNKLDAIDAIILKYITTVSGIKESEFFCPNLRQLMADLPILNLTRATLWERVLKYETTGLIELKIEDRLYIQLKPKMTEFFMTKKKQDSQSLFEQAYKKAIGSPCRFGEREKAKMQDDVKLFGEAAFGRAVALFFNVRTTEKIGIADFLEKAGRSYSVFSSQIEKIVAWKGGPKEPCKYCGEWFSHLESCETRVKKEKEEDDEPTLKGQAIDILGAFLASRKAD